MYSIASSVNSSMQNRQTRFALMVLEPLAVTQLRCLSLGEMPPPCCDAAWRSTLLDFQAVVKYFSATRTHHMAGTATPKRGTSFSGPHVTASLDTGSDWA